MREMLHWLVELRGERTQQQIADEIGIPQSTYAGIESEGRRPSVEMAKRIGHTMGFPWTRFFEDEREAKEEEK